MTRNLIIVGQGVIRCHPYVLRAMPLAAPAFAAWQARARELKLPDAGAAELLGR